VMPRFAVLAKPPVLRESRSHTPVNSGKTGRLREFSIASKGHFSLQFPDYYLLE
jgi:hypothetical protein